MADDFIWNAKHTVQLGELKPSGTQLVIILQGGSVLPPPHHTSILNVDLV